MTKAVRMTNAEGGAEAALSAFGIGSSFFFRHWSLDSGHSPEQRRAFVLETAAGETVRGPLVELAEKWSVRLGGTRRLRQSADEWLSPASGRRPPPAFPTGPHLMLTNGDRLPLTVATVELHRRTPGLHPSAAGARTSDTVVPVGRGGGLADGA